MAYYQALAWAAYAGASRAVPNVLNPYLWYKRSTLTIAGISKILGQRLMNITTLLESEIFVPALSGVFGVLLTIVTQRLLNRRSMFSYTVTHNRVGLSVEDAVYGSVKVTWNDNPVNRLYLSTVVVTNQSMKDHKSVVMRVFSNDTVLLAGTAFISDGIEPIDFSEEYKSKIAVRDGDAPTAEQYDLYSRQRDYMVPVINRGQILRFELLNTPCTEAEPTVWLNILHKGIACKHHVHQQQVMGVPQLSAAWTGMLLSMLGVGIVLLLVKSAPLAALISLAVGWFSILPGAYAVKFYRKMRDHLVG